MPIISIKQAAILLTILVLLLIVVTWFSTTVSTFINTDWNTNDEQLYDDPTDGPDRPDGIMSTHTNFPFWNVQLGSKRNMSYDIRGDIPIVPSYTGPWLNSGRAPPIYNKPLWMVS